MKNNFISVFISSSKVGTLALTKEGQYAFEYDKNWLINGFSISPFELPLEKKLFIAPKEPFSGNFGVFSDSVPDGWGKLLMDRMFLQKGISLRDVTDLDRLSVVGSSGIGALRYEPEYSKNSISISSDIEILAKEFEEILNDKPNIDNLEGYIRAGGSSAGARPKVFINYNGVDWLVKFKASNDPKNIGIIEYEYSKMAKKSGIEMPETMLFKDKYFGSKRFDISEDKSRVHVISASTLLKNNHKSSTIDYKDLLELTLKLTRDYNEVKKMFKLMCFNVLTYNRDDHSKNFSFMYLDKKWKLSPAYDLVYSNGAGLVNEQSTSVLGKGKNIEEEDFKKVGKLVLLNGKDMKEIIEEIKAAINSKEFNLFRKIMKK